MKKWIAMLLAVMMLVLPLAGLAEAPEELMDKALDDGLTLETTVSFSAGNLPFGEEINTPVADLLNALSFYHLENENDQSVFAVRLSGEDALRVETQMDVDDRDYFKFNWLGDSVLSFNESELETTMKRIVEVFAAAMGMDKENLQSVLSGAVNTDMDVDDALDLDDMDAQPLMDFIASLSERAETADVTEQPADCDPAVKAITITITAEDLAQFYEILFTMVRSNEELMSVLSTYGNATLNGESMTVEEMMDQLPAQIRERKDQIPDIPLVLYLDADNGLVKMTESMTMAVDDSEPVTAEFIVNRNTAEIGVTYDATLTAVQGTDNNVMVKVSVLTDSKTTDDVSMAVYALGSEQEDAEMFRLSYAAQKNYAADKAERHSTVTLRFRPEVNAEALELTLQNDTTAAYDGKAFSKSAEHKLYLSNESDPLVTMTRTTATVDAPASLANGEVVTPGTMDDADFQTWLNGALTNLTSGATKALRLLPASVLQVILSLANGN